MCMRLLVVVVSLVFTASAWAQKNKLNVFIWSDYLDPKLIERFENEYDCKVTLDLYEDNESMMAKLQGGGAALYDICVPSDYIIPALIKNKLLAPLRQENIPNVKNLDPTFLNHEYDPGNKYTLPFQWGTYGLYLRKRPGEQIDETWGLIFDPTKQIGTFVIVDDPRVAIGAALKYKGYSLNTTDKKQLKQAGDLLVEAKKRSLGFEGALGVQRKVLAKVCRVGVTDNGDAVKGMVDDSETYYFIPREGSVLWLDTIAIPANAPHRDMAEKFINYILDPKIGALLSNYSKEATPITAAREFLNPADRESRAIYPSPEITKVLEFVKDLGAKTAWYDELWTSVKSK